MIRVVKTILLVDAENFGVSATKTLCEKVVPDLAVFVGDFNRRELAGWAGLNARANEVRYVSEVSNGKNCSDVALTVAAMQAISDDVEIFYLASADHDFGPLIRHVERKGIRVVQVLMNDNARPCHTDVMYLTPPSNMERIVMTAVSQLSRSRRHGFYATVDEVARSITGVELTSRDIVRIVRKHGGRVDDGRIYMTKKRGV